MDVEQQYQVSHPPRRKMKKKKEEVPLELKVCKKMNLKELKRYFFPNNPESRWDEQALLSGLDLNYKKDAELARVERVSSRLLDPIRKEFQKAKYYVETDVKLGQPVDIESLLFPCQNDYLVRRNGRKVTAKTLRGKYIMVCCFSLPAFWCSDAWKAVVACSEIYSKLKGQFEMVIVTKMRRGWTRNKSVFNQFFSAFPPPCLAVPFQAQSRRHLICKSIGVIYKFLLVAPDGNALLHSELRSFDHDLAFVPLYGPDSRPFPFVSRTFVTKDGRIVPMFTAAFWNLSTPSSLEDFLCCDFVFRTISLGSQTFSHEQISISELKSKLVGLYLYTSGLMLPVLTQIMEACRQSDKELEIVLVFIPTDIVHNPCYYPEVLSRALAKRNISCWVAPFSNTASIVLDYLFKGEKVIIVEPSGPCIETRGVELMRVYGNYAYPFTFHSVVQKTVDDLRQVTLESFFELLGMVPGSPSRGKTVHFYFDNPFNISVEVYSGFANLCMCEGVLIHIMSFTNAENFRKVIEDREPEHCDSTDFSLKVLWNTKAADRSRDFFLKFFNGVFPTIVAFGPDGKICSVLAHINPSPCCLPSSEVQIKDNLCKEVSSVLEKFFTHYDDMELKYDREPQWLQDIQEARQRVLSWI